MSLKLQNISYGYSHSKKLFTDVSLQLEKGKIFTLMGGNGAGKTTLFNIISGFIKPQKGNIFFEGTDITRFSPFKTNLLGIGRTFQDLRIITWLSVKDNIILSMKNNPSDRIGKAILPSNFYSKAVRPLGERTAGIITNFFLSEIQNSRAGDISYGQQKLLTLACCVANNASLILLDEPVAGIQPEYRNKIAVLIKELKAQGKTIMIIEHNTEFIAEVSDHIFFLHDSKISSFKNIEEVKADPFVMETYIYN